MPPPFQLCMAGRTHRRTRARHRWCDHDWFERYAMCPLRAECMRCLVFTAELALTVLAQFVAKPFRRLADVCHKARHMTGRAAPMAVWTEVVLQAALKQKNATQVWRASMKRGPGHLGVSNHGRPYESIGLESA